MRPLSFNCRTVRPHHTENRSSTTTADDSYSDESGRFPVRHRIVAPRFVGEVQSPAIVADRSWPPGRRPPVIDFRRRQSAQTIPVFAHPYIESLQHADDSVHTNQRGLAGVTNPEQPKPGYLAS